MADDKQEQNEGNPLDKTVDKMRAIGLDPNDVVKLFLPVINQAISAAINGLELPKLVEVAVNKKGDLLANQVIEALNQRAAQEAAANPAAPAPNSQNTPTGVVPRSSFPPGIPADNPMMAMLFNTLLGGNKATGDGSLDQMAKLASSWGNVMKAIMQPVVEMQTTMRQNLLQEITTYSKTGGTLPWEGNTPERHVANLNQGKILSDEDRKAIAKDIAKRIRLG